VPLFAVVLARRAHVAWVAYSTDATLRPARRDWRETRSWERVGAVAVASVVLAVTAGGLAGGTAAVSLVGLGVALGGTVLLWYCWHRLGGALV
jgi:hypothetical protein